MIEPILFYSLILGASILCITIALIAFYFRGVLKNLQSQRQKEIGASYESAEQIIEAAKKKAAEIISTASVLSSDEKSKVLSEIENVTRSSSLKISQEVYEKAVSDINLFRDNLKKEMARQIDLEREEIKKHLEDSLTQIVQEVSKEVINKSLSISEHEDIVINALQDALTRHEL